MGTARDCSRVCEALRGPHASRILGAAWEAVERRDPAWLYHRLSSLEPGYHGWEPTVRRERDYYKEYPGAKRIPLPRPPKGSGLDVLEAIRRRRSRRSYSRAPLSLVEVGTLLCYTLGVVGRAWWGGPKRAYPSAGALQPVEAYIVAGEGGVEGLEAGVYHYNPGAHALELLAAGDYREALYRACLEQEHVLEAPVSVVLTVVYSRTTSYYGVRGYRYVLLDAGFAGENLYLAAEALGLATVAVGAFYDWDVCGILGIDCRWEFPLLVFPVGRRRG